jgi:hypothetical protein
VPQSFRQSAKPVQTSLLILAGLDFLRAENSCSGDRAHTEFGHHIEPVGYMNLFAERFTTSSMG